MARTVRDAILATRSARLRLAVTTKPYWRTIEQGLHLGYRRRGNGGTWVARRRIDEGAYRETRIGLADDLQDADGALILNFAQAQTAARAWWLNEQRLANGFGRANSGPYTVRRACADYLDDYRRRGGKAFDTINYSFNGHVLPALSDVVVSKLTARRIQDWHRALAERPRRVRSKPNADQNFGGLDPRDPEAVRRRRATANRILTYFKAALNLAWREGAVPSDDAWRRVKPFRGVEAPVIRYLTQDEVTRLLNACEGAFRDLVHGALMTGCRYGELCRLTVGDYNPDVGSLTIRVSKGGKARHVTLSEEGVELIERLIAGCASDELMFRRDDGLRWGTAHQLRPMNEACERAGIVPKATFNILRHTHGSCLAMQGVPMAVIARQLGHTDTRMTERHYAHLAPNYVSDTIRASFPRMTPAADRKIVPLRVSAP